MDGPKIDIDVIETETDPTTTVFLVCVTYEDDQWRHTFGSRGQLDAYLDGLTAGFGLNNVFVRMPEVPNA